MQHRSSRSAGFSIIELLVVVAIIGTLSLIGVPAFMNFQRQNQIRAAMRMVATDLRSARTIAAREQMDVRVTFTPSAIDSDAARTYNFHSSRNGGTTWTAMNIRATPFKRIERPVWIESANGLTTAGGAVSVIFHADGTAELENAATNEGRLVLFVPNSDELRSNRYNVRIRRSGIVRGLPSECSDQTDNDSDGKIDKQPPTATDTADTECANTQDNNEAA
jgi:prepilin-type N-terminal cleavage/methylation domain-containing protein